MFQTQVNTIQAPGVSGDFASLNPFSSLLAGGTPGGGGGTLVAPVGGCSVGRFIWVNPTTLAVQTSYLSTGQVGFIGRNEQALITTFLGETTYVIPQGFMVNAFNGGDFWAKFNSGIVAGGTVYADGSTGHPTSSATNSVTASAGFTGTGSLATVSGQGVATIVTQTAGVINIGDTLAGTGVTAGTTITGFGTYTQAGGTGTVFLSAAPTTESTEALTTTSTVLNVTALVSGGLNTGDPVTGTGVTAGTTITSVPAQGALGLGAYGLSVAQNFASTTVSGPTAYATQFKAASSCNPGEIAKISAPAL